MSIKAQPFLARPVEESFDYINLIIYGEYGLGKTHFCGSSALVPEMRDILYLALEAGEKGLKDIIRQLKSEGLNPNNHILVVPIESFGQYGNVYKFLQHHLKYRDAEIEDEESTNNLRKLEAQIRGIIYKDVDELKLKIPVPMRFRTVITDSLTEAQKYKMYDLLGIDPSQHSLNADFDKPAYDEWYSSKEAIQFLVRRYRDLPINSLFVASQATEVDAKKQIHYHMQMPGKLDDIQGMVDLVIWMTASITEQKAIRRFYFVGGKVDGLGYIQAKNRFGPALKSLYLDNIDMRNIYELDRQS